MIVLLLLTRKAAPYPLFALNVQSWILLLSPWIWTPFGLFCAMTQLISVVLPAVWMPPPPVVEPEMALERTMQLSMSTAPAPVERPAPPAPKATVFPMMVQYSSCGDPLSTRTAPPRNAA